jgi:hypothetical protein
MLELFDDWENSGGEEKNLNAKKLCCFFTKGLKS